MPNPTQPIIGPYDSQPAACRDHDPRAAVVAGQIAVLISERLPQIRVEHIGSTSVAGCAGNGIVDLMIAVPDGATEGVKGALESLGFQKQTGRDPFPEDRPMRVGSVSHDGETFWLHVHVIPANSPEVDELRFFRTCLRNDPELLRLYVARKQEIIAGGTTDPIDYRREKGKFIKEVLG